MSGVGIIGEGFYHDAEAEEQRIVDESRAEEEVRRRGFIKYTAKVEDRSSRDIWIERIDKAIAEVRKVLEDLETIKKHAQHLFLL